jgi:hypothetical protein
MTQAKAIIGGIAATLLAGLSSLASILVGSDTLSHVTTVQWVVILIAMITTGSSVYAGVWAVSNNPASIILPAPEYTPITPSVAKPAELPVTTNLANKHIVSEPSQANFEIAPTPLV